MPLQREKHSDGNEYARLCYFYSLLRQQRVDTTISIEEGQCLKR